MPQFLKLTRMASGGQALYLCELNPAEREGVNDLLQGRELMQCSLGAWRQKQLEIRFFCTQYLPLWDAHEQDYGYEVKT